jgi:DNA modification methylase
MIKASPSVLIRPIHPFPARMAPSIVWNALPKKKKQLTILDPMSGSGTSLVYTRARGHQAIGCDIDPLALVISRAWCSDVDRDALKRKGYIVLKRAMEVAQRRQIEDCYPSGADAETRQFIDFWFDEENCRQLTALATSIAQIKSYNERALLWSAFSRLIITKKIGVSLAMDVSHSRPHKVYEKAPIHPFDKFMHSVSYIADKSPFTADSAKGPEADISYGDARCLPLPSQSVDMIITSPPYLNAIDYIRGHKLSLVWMGHTIAGLRSTRAATTGSTILSSLCHSKIIQDVMSKMGDVEYLNTKYIRMIHRYLADINKIFEECARVLKPDCRATFVIGDCTIMGVFIRNSVAFQRMAKQNGFVLMNKSSRPILQSRRYLPPPNCDRAGEKMQKRIKEEVILNFQLR